MKVRLREYLHERKHVMTSQRQFEVVTKLSASLRVEVTMMTHGEWLEKLWFLKGVEQAALVQIAARMEPMVYAPGEQPPKKKFYVLQRGIVLCAAKVLTVGKVWGEDFILQSDEYDVPYVARAMTYIEANTLSREALMEELENFPTAIKAFRRAVVLVALRRAIITLAARGAASKGRHDFLDQVLSAVQVGGENTPRNIISEVKARHKTTKADPTETPRSSQPACDQAPQPAVVPTIMNSSKRSLAGSMARGACRLRLPGDGVLAHHQAVEGRLNKLDADMQSMKRNLEILLQRIPDTTTTADGAAAPPSEHEEIPSGTIDTWPNLESHL